MPSKFGLRRLGRIGSESSGIAQSKPRYSLVLYLILMKDLCFGDADTLGPFIDKVR